MGFCQKSDNQGFLYVAIVTIMIISMALSVPAYATETDTPDPLGQSGENVQTQQATSSKSEFRRVTLTRYLPSSYVGYSKEQVQQLLNSALSYDKDGFRGTLALSHLSLDPIYRISQQQVDKEMQFPGLPVPDVALLPLTYEFEILDGETMDSTTTTELNYTAVRWSKDATDYAGRPSSYTATVTYRGIESVRLPDYLKVIAQYDGEVSTVATHLVTRAGAVMTSNIDLADGQTPLASIGTVTSGFPIEVTVLLPLAAIMIIALILFLYRYRNVCLICTQGSMSKTLLRKHIRLIDGYARLSISGEIPLLANCDSCHVSIKGSLAKQQGILEVVWDGFVVVKAPLAPHIDIGDCVVRQIAPLTV